MLDSDLAKIYGVPTFRFNEAIKRNRHRFPADFGFAYARTVHSLTSQIAMSKAGRGGRRSLPFAFTVRRSHGREHSEQPARRANEHFCCASLRQNARDATWHARAREETRCP